MDLQYLPYDLGNCYVPSITSRALPTSKKAILLERGSKHRHSAVSSSIRLATSIGGLWGLLGKHFCNPRILLGRPQESAESRLGSLFQTPYFLGDFVNVPNAGSGFGAFSDPVRAMRVRSSVHRRPTLSSSPPAGCAMGLTAASLGHGFHDGKGGRVQLLHEETGDEHPAIFLKAVLHVSHASGAGLPDFDAQVATRLWSPHFKHGPLRPLSEL